MRVTTFGISALVLALVACNRGYKPYETGDSEYQAAMTDDFRATFAVDKSTLKSCGNNPYFAIQPGAVSRFQSGHETLTITVLAETRVIDGVETRIVEEREETPRGLKEVSRNFFACDPATGDVYYFGEEVDIYENGEIASHAGAWKSGEGGARFGLMMPGQPIMGDRFYQEVAPGIAMDRVEIVNVADEVATPGGNVTRAIRVIETTPLERGSSTKIFAPGLGLVKDGDLYLVSRTDG
ncbi:MAG: hypothetical protein KF691_08035 [Phycisphaeraceae bacterium]|nr:hypothetical protein [Phycisphaeraceae bacterium]